LNTFLPLEMGAESCRDVSSLSSAQGSKISHRLLYVCFWSSGHQHRSIRRHQLSVPHVCHSMFRSCAFSVARQTVWNSLPDDLYDPAVVSEHVRQDS